MTYAFTCCATTHIGNRRVNNEDNFFIAELLSPEEQSSMSQTGTRVIQKRIYADGTVNRIYAVSDGMGGHKDGEVASSMVVEAIRNFSNQHQTRACFKRQDKFEYIQAFQQMIHKTNLDMLDCSAGENAIDNMGATLSGLITFADEAVVFNIGDSSTFIFENGVLRKLTIDDNEAEKFSGLEVEALEANGKRLTKYFGMSTSNGLLTARISPPTTLRVGQIFLIASDGLTENLSLDRMAEIIQQGKEDTAEISTQLIESALEAKNGGRDNITAVVLRVQKYLKQRSYRYG